MRKTFPIGERERESKNVDRQRKWLGLDSGSITEQLNEVEWSSIRGIQAWWGPGNRCAQVRVAENRLGIPFAPFDGFSVLCCWVYQVTPVWVTAVA